MKAIVYTQNALPIDDPASLHEMDLPRPSPGPRDLLVAIKAIAVNPVDSKVRHRAPVTEPRILGWDAVGTVEETGSEVTLFKKGDEVFYAGSIARPGSYAEYSLVDERIAGPKPRSIDDAQAAALPLTTLTAYELLFDRLGVAEGGGEGQVLLVIGAGGGVGSILVQLARRLTKLTVVGTASRKETIDWVTELGAHHVIDHGKPLADQLQAIGIAAVDIVASLTHTDDYFAQLPDLIKAQGRFGIIDDPASLDVTKLKSKAISLHWESMFTRSVYGTDDIQRQHDILARASALIDDGTLKTTMGEHFGRINAANLRKAHKVMESHTARGKIVLEGF